MIKSQNTRNRMPGRSVSKQRPWVFLALLLVVVALLVVACSSAADEQASADEMTLEAAAQQEAEMLTATSQAVETVMADLEAATRVAELDAIVQAPTASMATEKAVAAANEQATADAQATVSAEATISAVETMASLATAEAEAMATASYEATQEAFKTEQLSLIRNVQFDETVVNIEEGSLALDEDEDPEIQAANVELRNFVAHTHFLFEPGETDLDNFDVGLEFRSGDEGSTFLILNQDGSWQLISSEDGDEKTIQEGQTDALQDGWNELDLYVDDDEGFFSLNGEYVQALDLNESAERGDIVLVTGMGEGTEADGAYLQFKELQVWSMDPIPPTPTPAPTSSAPQQVSAPTFPETPIKPFDRDEFVSYVGQLRDSLRSYTSEMDLMRTTHKPGDCGTFRGWIGLWILQSPGYTNVPPSFASLYRDYRSLLSQVVSLSQEIRDVCDAGGGFVSDETIDAINEFLSWAYPRSEELVAEASALPAP
jgi:hypothetical protein